MLPASRRENRLIEPLIATSTSWVRAPASGVVRARVTLGQRVKTDETLAVISNPFGDTEVAVSAPAAGLIIGRSNLPLALEGDALFHIARFDSVARAQDAVAEFRNDVATDEAVAGINTRI
jgi:predicted deacylase